MLQTRDPRMAIGLLLMLLVLIFGPGWQTNPVLPPAVPMPLVVGGLALPPIIVAVVELAKRLGMPTKYAPYLNGLLSLLGYGAVILTQLKPETTSLVTYVLGGLVVFLMGAGIYDRAQATVGLVKRS